MVQSSASKSKQARISQQLSYEEQIAQLKNSFFKLVYPLLKQNESASSYPYYLLVLIEHVAMLWFILHPGLSIYQNAFFLDSVLQPLKIINFYEYLVDNPLLYQSMMMGLFIYICVQVLVFIGCVYSIHKKYEGEIFKYLRKIVNYQFLITVKVVSGPAFGLLANVVYCVNNNYHHNQICYDATYISYCAIAALVALIILAQIALFALVYYIKNPLSSSYLAEHNRFHLLSKNVIKILMPIYFALDSTFQISMVYMICLVGLWGAYIFWHRLFSIHTYEQQHFYIEYFMEVAIFWMAACNVIFYYVNGGSACQQMSFVYAVITSLLVALFMVNFERASENNFVSECLQNKIKKQNMQKFIFILIHRLLHTNISESKVIFHVYVKLLQKNETIKPLQIKLPAEDKTNLKKQIYQFLLHLIQEYLEQNNSVILKTLKCYILCVLGKKSYGIHQSLELSEEKLGFIDEFAMFQFRTGENLFENDLVEKENRDFIKYYRFYEQLSVFENLTEECASNNTEYWQQLCEQDPSLAKLRNLATLYSIYQSKIAKQFTKINDILPQNLYATNLYLNYLVNVGINIDESIKIKQKLNSIYESKIRGIRISDSDTKEDDQVTIIALNSISNNLGVIINSNSHVKQLLGYDKNGLIGKNITKLMPKIYTELHNQFMLNFIRSENSHLRPSERQVTAINKNSLLVELNLNVKIMNSEQSQLVVVGFMKKLPLEMTKGLLMYSATNGEILGIDANFMAIMNNKLTGKQVVQEEVKLSVLLPELNLELLEKEGIQQTLLEVGSVIEDEGNEPITQKKISMKVKNIKYYEGIMLGFVSITDLNSDQKQLAVEPHKKKQKKSSLILKKVLMNNLRHNRSSFEKYDKDQFQNMLRMDSSLSESQQAVNETSSSGLNKQLPMARKLQEFIKIRKSDKLQWLLKLIYIICIIGCTTVAVVIFSTHSSYLDTSQNVYSQMNDTINIVNSEAQINIYTSKIWNTSSMDFSNANYAQYFQPLQDQIALLQSVFYTLYAQFKSYNYPLQYNQNDLSNFIISKAVYGKIQFSNISIPSADALTNYISSATAIAKSNNSSSTPITRTKLQQQALGVKNNGQSLLPNVGMSAANSFSSYFTYITNNELTQVQIMKSLLLVAVVVCLLGMAVLGNYINKANEEIVNIYTNIKLSDIGDILLKCNKFSAKEGKVGSHKSRGQSLLKLNAQKPMMEAVKESSIKELSVKAPTLRLRQDTQQRFLMTEQSRVEPEVTSQIIVTEQTAECEQARLKEAEHQEMVKIYWQLSSTKIIIVSMILILIVAGVIGFSYFFITSNNSNLLNYMDRLLTIGKIRKYFIFMDYYAYRMIDNKNDINAKLLLLQEVQKFYDNTQHAFSFIGDPYPILKNSYSIVQTLQQWATNADTSSKGVIRANYSIIGDALQTANMEIIDLDFKVYYPQYLNMISSSRSTELIFMATLIVLICAAVLLMDSLYLQPIRKHRQHSMNMLKIIPPWMMQRNEKAAQMIML